MGRGVGTEGGDGIRVAEAYRGRLRARRAASYTST